MYILVIGINHQIASVQIRELFNLTEKTRPGFIDALRKTKCVQECVVLNTCNRFEIYAAVDHLNIGKYYLKEFLYRWFGVSKEVLNVEPAVVNLKNVFLYDVDALECVIEMNRHERKQEAQKIEQMIDSEILEFQLWLRTLGVIPLITALRNKASNVHTEAMQHIEKKLPSLTERETKIIRKYSKMIVNQMIHEPVIAMKEMVATCDNEERQKMFNTFVRIFSLEEDLQNQVNCKPIIIEEERNPFQPHLVKSNL